MACKVGVAAEGNVPERRSCLLITCLEIPQLFHLQSKQCSQVALVEEVRPLAFLAFPAAHRNGSPVNLLRQLLLRKPQKLARSSNEPSPGQLQPLPLLPYPHNWILWYLHQSVLFLLPVSRSAMTNSSSIVHKRLPSI